MGSTVDISAWLELTPLTGRLRMIDGIVYVSVKGPDGKEHHFKVTEEGELPAGAVIQDEEPGRLSPREAFLLAFCSIEKSDRQAPHTPAGRERKATRDDHL